MMSFDAIVVGGGHNGLVAATLLAMAGRKVALFEASAELGGGAKTVEFHPGFKVPELAHVINRLHSDVIKAMELEKHGLKLGKPGVPISILDEHGKPLVLEGIYGETISGELGEEEKQDWLALRGRLLKQAAIYKQVFDHMPPPLERPGWREMLRLGKTALSLRMMGKIEMRHFLRMMLMCVDDVGKDHISDDRLRGLLALDATMGAHLGPRSPTSVLGLFYRLDGEVDGVMAGEVVPVGGPGAVIATMENSARAAGVEIHCGAKIARIDVTKGSAVGVTLDDGRVFTANTVFSSADPKTTFLNLAGPRVLETGFVRAVSNIRMKGDAARLFLALDKVPQFKGLSPTALAGRMVIAPSSDYVDWAFNPSKYGELAAAPAMEITVPSIMDTSMAPAGKAVLSVTLQHCPYDLKVGWEIGRTLLTETALNLLERYAPGIKSSVIASELLAPPDIEKRCNMTGGHWHHGELQADQMAMMRPVPTAARYATPINNLYLCGAGSHPGGGISGLPALNAVKTYLGTA